MQIARLSIINRITLPVNIYNQNVCKNRQKEKRENCMTNERIKKVINIETGTAVIEGELTIPQNALGIVLFAHGSGSSRFSSRNNYVAQILQKHNLATLLIDLLTREEDMSYANRFNVDILSERLIQITRWLRENEETKNLKIGYFGASTGAAAAVNAAAVEDVSAVVSRGGRVDLAEQNLSKVKAPVLLIAGGSDDFVLEANREALKKVASKKELAVVPYATHLFEEPGALEKVAELTSQWFVKFFS